MFDFRDVAADAGRLVDEDGTRASRRIFCDPDIFDLEVRQIFHRSWLYIGHTSELPTSGSYVTRPMGGDPVILVRGEDGGVRGFLNACRHRGMPLCRADAGTARRFVCPYHSWTYRTDGALQSTSFDQHYEPAQLAGLGLTPIPRLDTYRGLIFGSWDRDAPPLEKHLGELRWYLDMLFARTPAGMTVLGPPQRWIVETNWKIPALNFMDTQHAIRTHRGPLTMAEGAGAPPLHEIARIADATPQVSFPEGHGIVLGVGAAAAGLPEFFGHPPEVSSLYRETLAPAQLEQLRSAPPAVGTLFPNTSWVEQILAVAHDRPPRAFFAWRNWHPVSADRVEIWSWYFAEAEASDESRVEMHRIALQTFGAGGIFEEDDAEIWASISRSIRGPAASREYMHFDAGRAADPVAGFPGKGTAWPSLLGEQAQVGFLRRWKALMTGDSAHEAVP